MKKKNLFICAILIVALTVTFSMGPLEAAKRRYVSIAAGWVTGAYFPMAGAISRIAWKHLKDEGIKVTAESSGASVANAKLIGAGDTDFAILQNDIASYAYNGKEGMFDDPIPSLLGVCTLFPEHVQIVARKDSNIKSIADLKGKKVAIGPVGSGTTENATQILEAWGLTADDLAKSEQLTASQSADYLKDGRLDAAFFTVALGAAVIMDTGLMVPIDIVPVEGPNVEKLIEKYPFYAKQMVPGKTYKENDSDIPTVSVMAMLAASAEIEEDIVYSIINAIYSDLEQLKKAHAKFQDIEMEKGLIGMGIPLHPGAEKYFKEKGLIQ